MDYTRSSLDTVAYGFRKRNIWTNKTFETLNIAIAACILQAHLA